MSTTITEQQDREDAQRVERVLGNATQTSTANGRGVKDSQLESSPAMKNCHCGQTYHIKLCKEICPTCHCYQYDGAADCWTLRQRAYVERELAKPLHVPTETEDEQIAWMVSQGFIVEGCKGCEVFFREPGAFAPRHKASSMCRSGKRSHCSCDCCF